MTIKGYHISENRLVFTLVSVFTLLQLIILIIFGYTPYPDSNGYILLAKECLLYGEPYPAAATIHELPFIWNIAAINLVALSLKFFSSITPLLVLYSFMKGASAWLVYKITYRIFDNKTALLALLIYICYPANYGESTSTLSELPFIFFILSAIYLYQKNCSITAGIFLAIANSFRPMAFLFLIVLLIYDHKHILRTVSSYVLIILLIGSSTYIRTGRFIYQAKTGWMDMMLFSLNNINDEYPDPLYIENNDRLDCVQRDSVWRSRSIHLILKHPAGYIASMPYKLIKTFVSDNVNMCTFIPDKNTKTYMYNEISMPTLYRSFPHYSAVQVLTLINLIYYYLLLITSIYGCILLIRKQEHKKLIMPVSVVLIGSIVIITVCHGEARYHIPFIPFIIMVAATAIRSTPFFPFHSRQQ